ncbi:unnamed protein product [Phytomonas sp. Hart1]|nr:unnamed protein product [Phytomonas sp. Hart1]|eukprot:CCW67597.1 unnamed protein product [Phytomonas sp. isolate Hart1]
MFKDTDILSALQLLQPTSTSDVASRERAVCLLLDNAPLVLQQHKAGTDQEPLLRHIVKALAIESTSMSESKWDLIFELVGSLLSSPGWTPSPADSSDSVNTVPKAEVPQGTLSATPTTYFSWALRAFVLKYLPCMALEATWITNTVTDGDHVSAPLSPMMTRRGKAVCDILINHIILSHEQDYSTKQLTRVAQSSLLALPPSLLTHVAHELIRWLPRSRDTCLAIIQNPSATEPLWRGFEEALLETSDSSISAIAIAEGGDSITEPGITAALARDCVKRILQQHYKAYGMVKINRLCDALVQRGLPKTLGEMERYRAEVVRPLIELGEVCGQGEPSLQTPAHRDGIPQRVPLPFLYEALGDLYRQYESATSVFLHQEQEYEITVLNLARDLTQLSLTAVLNSELPNDTVNQLVSVLMPKVEKSESPAVVTNCDSSLMEEGFIDRIPLPLMECVLLLLNRAILHRSLKRSPESHIDIEEKEHNDDICVKCARFLKNVLLPEVQDVAFQLSVAINEKGNGIPRLPNETGIGSTPSDSQVRPECSSIKATEKISWGCLRGEERLKVMNAELHEQLTILSSIIRLCEEIWQQTQKSAGGRLVKGRNTFRGRLPHMTPSWILNPVEVYGAPCDVDAENNKRARFSRHNFPRKLKRWV